MSEPDSQAKACAQAGAQVDINVRVTTGGAAAAASASAQPNAQRPAESTQPNIAGFFSKRPAQKEPAPEMVGAQPYSLSLFTPRNKVRLSIPILMHALPMCDLRFDLRFHQMFDLSFDLSDLIFLRRLRPLEPVPAPLDGQGRHSMAKDGCP